MRWTSVLVALALWCVSCGDDEASVTDTGTDTTDEPRGDDEAPVEAELDGGPPGSAVAVDAAGSPREACGNTTALFDVDDGTPPARLEGALMAGDGACPGVEVHGDSHHELDLRSADELVRLSVLVEASFDPIIQLSRGPCADTAPGQCVLPIHSGGLTNTWSGEVEPGRYVLSIVSNDTSEGDYRVLVVAEPIDAECAAAQNDSCETATLIDTSGHSVIDWVGKGCGEEDEYAPLYYELDLSDELDMVGVYARLEPVGGVTEDDSYVILTLLAAGSGADDDACGEQVAEYNFLEASATIGAALLPDVYLLELDGRPTTASALSVQFTRPDCSLPAHDTCETAQEVELDGGYLRIEDHTYCNTNTRDLADDCAFEESPDRFYRVDLTEHDDRVRFRGRILPRDLNFYAGLALLSSEGDGCGNTVSCYDGIGDGESYPEFDMILEPGVYFVAVAGAEEGNAGSYTLELAVEEPAQEAFSSCYYPDLEEGVYYNDVAWTCCDNPFDPMCPAVFISAGLDPSVVDCVCSSNPICCDGDVEDMDACAETFAACDFFCEGYAAESFWCLGDNPELFVND